LLVGFDLALKDCTVLTKTRDRCCCCAFSQWCVSINMSGCHYCLFVLILCYQQLVMSITGSSHLYV